MHPIRQIEIRNFKCHEHIQWRLDKGITVVVAPNGKGKSSFEQAISWCLFGPSAVPCNQEDLIRDNSDECYVSVDICFGGLGQEVYTFERRYSSRDGSVARIYNHGELLANKPSGVDEFLKNRGIDLDGFNLIRAEQGELSFFVYATPAVRKAVVSSLFQVDLLDDVVSKARSLQKDLSEELDDLPTEEDIIPLKEIIAECTEIIDESEERACELENELEEIAGQLDEASEAVKSIPQVHAVEKSIRSLEGAIEDLEREKKNILSADPGVHKPTEHDLEVAEYCFAKAKSDFESAEEKVVDLKIVTSGLEEKIKNISDGKCPVCGVEGETLEDILEGVRSSYEANRKFLDAAEAERDRLRKEYSEANSELSDVMESFDVYADWEKLGGRVRIDVIDEKIDEYRESILGKEVELNSFPEYDTQLVYRLQEEVTERRENLSLIRSEIRKVEYKRESAQDALDVHLDRIRDLRMAIKKEESVRKLAKTLPIFRDLTLSQSLDWVADRASVLLSSALEDNFEITIDTSLGFWLDNRELSNYSGGQVDLVCVCIRIALSEYLSDRVGIDGLLILDGVFDRIDEDNRDAIGRLLSGVQIDQVLVLSHFEVPIIGGREIRIR